MSYSRKEREAFDGCDRGNQCHKEVLRAIKHMRSNHPTLRKLSKKCNHMCTDLQHLPGTMQLILVKSR